MKKFKQSISFVIFFLLLIVIYNYLTNILIYNYKNNDQVYNESSNLESNNFIKAYVSRIIDGDTIEVIIDKEKYKIRFIGIDCPEFTSKIEYFGMESTEYTKSMLLNKEIYLEKDTSNTDKYGRLLRFIWLQIPYSYSIEEIKDKMFNAMLLKNGDAYLFTCPPDIKYSNIFKQISEDAQNNKIGLWNKIN